MADSRSLEQVVARLEAIEAACLRRGDRRSIFATLYGLVSAEIHVRVRDGYFLDNDWAHRYGVTFANLYFAAFDAADAGQTDAVPKAWRLCFDAAASGRTLALQDLLLGMNAHINNDLPLALVRVSIDPDRDARRHDHLAVNAILAGVAQRAIDRLAALYAPGLRTLDEAAGELDELMGQFSIEVARENAWEGAVSLTNARNDAERRLVATMIGSRAVVLARLLRVASLSPTLIAVCRRLEAGIVFRNLLSC